MAVPLYLSLATIAFSLVFPSSKESNAVPVRSSSFGRNRGSSGDGWSGFGTGVLCGLSIWCIWYELDRRRFWDDCRLLFLKWLEDLNEERDDESTLPERDTERLRKPANVHNVPGKPMSDNGGIRRIMVSSRTASTSRMCVEVLMIPIYKQLEPRPAEGVEFYYVMQGQAEVRKCVDPDSSKFDSNSLGPGDAVVIDPKCVRGFTSRGRGDLILLRATDVASICYEEEYDRISSPNSSSSFAKAQAASISSMTTMMSKGFQKVETLVKAYRENRSSEEAEE